MKLMILMAIAAVTAGSVFGGALDNAWIKGTTDKDPVPTRAGRK